MTALDDRPRNGNTVPVTLPTQPPLGDAAENDTTDTNTTPAPQESAKVQELRQLVAGLGTERELLYQLSEIQSDPVFDDVRSDKERSKDREVAEKLRAKQRTDRLRDGKAQVRHHRRLRWQQRWDARAERTRERLLDPARNLGSDHRRWVASSVALFALLAGGVAFMSHTVKLGLVGESGTWLAYLVEPLASVLLIVSLLAQFTGRQRGIEVPRRFAAFDAALALASLLLNTVPYGMRYGFDAGSLTVHLLTPALVVAAVIGWHIASGLYGQALANSKHDPILQDQLALLRAAVAAWDLPSDVSANQVIKYLRKNLPTGIGHAQARRVAQNFLGY